ncbi:MAG: preprotein translocase subunit SecE [Puniceicoccales bacterium]|jgi:preprotein translocase SecE subunit|nr:preprotein translocase subunit SecE [Puniceicoccales bacterium]MDR1232729.1 preprotein translocase subunit SecE [Puniceicoccales bacterium]
MLGKTKRFFAETLDELKKAAWPVKKELGKSTIVVIVGMFLISFYVSIIDFSLFNVVDFMIKCVRG